MKNITVISSSFRLNGNSANLADSFIKGTKENGNNVNLIKLKDIELKYCLGCLACQKTKVCVQKDGVNNLLDGISESDILVFVTPIYYYSISGQLKTFLDRLNPLFVRENKFKDIYLIASCADDDNVALDGAIKEIEGWMSCFNGTSLKGVIYGTSLTGVNDYKTSASLDEAYKMGLLVK